MMYGRIGSHHLRFMKAKSIGGAELVRRALDLHFEVLTHPRYEQHVEWMEDQAMDSWHLFHKGRNHFIAGICKSSRHDRINCSSQLVHVQNSAVNHGNPMEYLQLALQSSFNDQIE